MKDFTKADFILLCACGVIIVAQIIFFILLGVALG